MSSLEKIVSSSRKMNISSLTSRKSTASKPKQITDGIILRYRFGAKVHSSDLCTPYSGVVSIEGTNGGKLVGATSLGISNFVGMNQPFQIVRFFKTPDHFTFESTAGYESERAHLLINNPDAKDVSIDELKSFISNSSLTLRQYSTGQFMCADFASRLHNKAEQMGIRCGYVTTRGTSPSSSHSFNVFCAIDKKSKPIVIFVDMVRQRFITGSEFKKQDRKYIKEMNIFV